MRFYHFPRFQIYSKTNPEDFRQHRQTGGAHRRQRSDRAGLNVGKLRRKSVEDNMNLSRDEVEHGRNRAFVRHVDHMDLGRGLEHLAPELARGADSRRPIIQLVWIALGGYDGDWHYFGRPGFYGGR
jgi:hypothetical protein